MSKGLRGSAANIETPELCRALIAASLDGLATLDLRGRIESINDAALRLLQVSSPDRLIGAVWAAFWPGEMGEKARKAMDEAIGDGAARFQGPCPIADGAMKWWDIVITRVPDEFGQPARLLVVSRDVTDLRRSAADTAASDARYSFLAENANDIIVRGDLDGRILYISPACRRFGYEPDELIGKPADQQIHPDDRAQFLANNARLVSGEGQADRQERLHRFLTKEGGWVWLEGDPHLIRDDAGAPLEFLNVFRDVTDRKLAEAATRVAQIERRRQAERTALAVSAAQLGIWDWDIINDDLSWDRQMFQIFGMSEDEPLSFAAFEARIHPDDNYDMRREVELVLTSDKPYDTEFRVITPAGETKHVRALGALVRDPAGNPIRLVGANWDITSTRVLERSLRASEARVQNIIAHAKQAIVSVDAEGCIVGWNRHAEQIFGWSEPEALGQPMSRLIIPRENRTALQAAMARFLATGEGELLNRPVELTALRRSGEEFPVEMAMSAAPGPAGWEVTALIQDIGERKARVELFENAFHHAPIGMALVGVDGGFLKVNDAFCGIVGYLEQEMLNLDFQAITHPEDLEADLTQLNQLLAGAISSYSMDKRYVRSDGRLVWVRLSVSLVLESDGRAKHFVAQVQDLTASRQAEARYRLMAENSTDMIVVTDIDGQITFATPACRGILGCEPEDLVGQRQLDQVHPDDLVPMVKLLRNLAEGVRGERLRWRARHKIEGHWVWLESSPALIGSESDKSWGYCVDVIRDVTAQVAQDQALADTTLAAEAAAAAKAEFLANMSHEIRTPLTAVVGFAGLLAARDDLDATARHQVGRVDSASRALLTIVNDILDFSKLEAGQCEIVPRPTALATAASDALLMFEAQAAGKNLTLDLRGAERLPAWVSVDPDRLRQILLNLVGNAVKFTETGGVRVTLRHDAVDMRLHVEVTDTGIGLSPGARRKLFQRFSQIEGGAHRRHGGTGLGLAICKGLVEAMGGEIGVTSEPGKGSVFTFTIAAPLAQAPEAAQEAVETDAPLSGLRILVVDDNAFNRELARAILTQLGADYFDAPDGLAALDAAQASAFDVILLDIRMPGLDGPSVLARIRNRPGPNQHTPTLAFSADADLDQYLGIGFDGVVRKPIEPGALISALMQIAEQQNETTAPQDMTGVA